MYVHTLKKNFKLIDYYLFEIPLFTSCRYGLKCNT